MKKKDRKYITNIANLDILDSLELSIRVQKYRSYKHFSDLSILSNIDRIFLETLSRVMHYLTTGAKSLCACL